MKHKIAGYRIMLGLTQDDIAEKFAISKQAYRMKEIGKSAFNDREKIMFKNMLKDIFPNITIDEIFFAHEV